MSRVVAPGPIDQRVLFEKIGYKPHSKQQLFHESQARFRVAACGRRFGKTHMAARDLETKLLLPDQRFWIVGPNYDLGEKEFRVIWDDFIVKMALGRDKRVKKSYNRRQGELFVEFPWGSRVEVRSATHPQHLVGEKLHGIIMSEAAKQNHETWERYLRPALADVGGWATFVSTPEGNNWFYHLWRMGQDPKYRAEGTYESWKFPSWENHHVFPKGRFDPEIAVIEDSVSVEWFAQEIAADFSTFVGRIFDEFDESLHVSDVKFDPLLPNYVAFDWGFTKPLAAIEFQVAPFPPEVRVWREHYLSNKQLREHIWLLQQRAQPDGYHIDCCFGDAEDPEATQVVNGEFAPCESRPEAKKNWRQGIELMKRFLRMRDIGEADEYGTPKLSPNMIIDRSCSNLIKEFNNYRTKENARGSEMRGTGIVDTGCEDHALDALRYGLMHLFELGANRHLSEIYTASELDAGGGVMGPTDEAGIFTSGVSF